jgi:hypothetical protein
MMGILVERSKMQEPGVDPTILGVRFDLKNMVVAITEKRRADLLDEIRRIIASDRLASGQAGKLKGKLYFVSSQFLGRCGRAALRALSERQYGSRWDSVNQKWEYSDSRLTNPDGTHSAVKKALLLWQTILRSSRPRPIPSKVGGPADAIICTDGYFPDARKKETAPPRIGGVFFARWRSQIVYFSSVVSDQVMQRWLPRKTQIAQVELLAIIAAFEAFGPEIEGKRVIALVDSESALGAAIKGYSAKEDISDAVTRLWETIAKFGIIVYFDRISTDANISDGPSRNDFAIAKECDWLEQTITLNNR